MGVFGGEWLMVNDKWLMVNWLIKSVQNVLDRQ